ncbi:MAG: hypothetical protein JNJ83_21180 [Verrucomicrobiaceae bacterium]|nr:hypothetical protein [Verrucomicrobiaceae bacterium]
MNLRCWTLALGLTAYSLAEEPDQRLFPLPKAPPQDPAKVAMGRALFFDPILSATGDTACASCHHPRYAWADGRSTPLGVHSTGLGPSRRLSGATVPEVLARNTPSLLNVAFNKTMFWDNRANDLESQALIPIQAAAEMRGSAVSHEQAIPEMLKRLKTVPAYAKLSPLDVAQSLAAFERTLVTGDTPFDRYLRGDKTALTPLQEKGLEVFQRAGCTLCHNGPMLTDFKLHPIGVNDAKEPTTAFRTPTLRNLAHTGPYMHHGSMTSLEEVLLFYDKLMDQVSETLDGGDNASLPPLDPLLQRMRFLPEDHEPMLAFLKSLNSDEFDSSVPESVPSGLPVGGK